MQVLDWAHDPDWQVRTYGRPYGEDVTIGLLPATEDDAPVVFVVVPDEFTPSDRGRLERQLRDQVVPLLDSGEMDVVTWTWSEYWAGVREPADLVGRVTSRGILLAGPPIVGAGVREQLRERAARIRDRIIRPTTRPEPADDVDA